MCMYIADVSALNDHELLHQQELQLRNGQANTSYLLPEAVLSRGRMLIEPGRGNNGCGCLVMV